MTTVSDRPEDSGGQCTGSGVTTTAIAVGRSVVRRVRDATAIMKPSRRGCGGDRASLTAEEARNTTEDTTDAINVHNSSRSDHGTRCQCRGGGMQRSPCGMASNDTLPSTPGRTMTDNGVSNPSAARERRETNVRKNHWGGANTMYQLTETAGGGQCAMRTNGTRSVAPARTYRPPHRRHCTPYGSVDDERATKARHNRCITKQMKGNVGDETTGTRTFSHSDGAATVDISDDD